MSLLSHCFCVCLASLMMSFDVERIDTSLFLHDILNIVCSLALIGCVSCLSHDFDAFIFLIRGCSSQVDAGEPAPVIIPIPESAAHATLGFYEESIQMGRPCTMDLGFFRNPYVGRSFISPSQELRDLKVCRFWSVLFRKHARRPAPAPVLQPRFS